MLWIAFVVALISSLFLIPLVRKLSLKMGFVAKPRKDRWHDKPTATLGGIGIFLSFGFGVAVFILFSGPIEIISGSGVLVPLWAFLSGSILIFFLGLYDDTRPLSPPIKLAGQLVGAAIVVFLGFTTDFFSPRIEDETLAQLFNVLLTFAWIVGLTNAINLLDNMDGLAGGISLITAVILSYLFWTGGSYGLLVVSLALVGSLIGFLVFNFPPASIFMGDSGSLFLGFTLAVLAISRQPQASNVFAVLGVPTLLFLLPILDTGLVTFTRILRGESPTKGGSDHTSHRLIAFGFSERQAVILLYSVAIVAGIAAVSIETIGYWLSLVFVPILVLSLALLTGYLGGMKIVTEDQAKSTKGGAFSRFISSLTYKRRLFEVILDVVIIGIAYYLAYLIHFGPELNTNTLALYVKSLPMVIILTLVTFLIFGVYRGVWRYIGIFDLLRFFGSVLVSLTLIMIAVAVIFSGDGFEAELFILYAILLFLGLITSRASFRILDMASVQLRYKKPKNKNYNEIIDPSEANKLEERILIIGADNSGVMALRWIQANPQLNFIPLGFIDNDPYLSGRNIHGVRVIGGSDKLEEILETNNVNGVILTKLDAQGELEDKVITICTRRGCWVRNLRVEFESIE
jgi:UDP-GlcNAc:undecaprenyl-phosphate GlcNAc-1-phosphate transferase